MKCSNCGLESHPGARFCGHCGARVVPVPGEGGPKPLEGHGSRAQDAHSPGSGEDASDASAAAATTPSPEAATPPPPEPAVLSRVLPARPYLIGGALIVVLAVLAFAAERASRTHVSATPTPVASVSKTPPQRVETVRATPSVQLNYIDQFLKGQQCVHCTCLYSDGETSPLLGTGGAFQDNGTVFNIDPRLIVAIAGQETSFGLHTCCTRNNNAWNWFWCYASNSCQGQPCQHSPFDSWSSGIKTVSKYMRKNYLSRGYNTIDLIGHKYCIDNCSAWVGGVTRFYKELGGDPDQLMPPP